MSGYPPRPGYPPTGYPPPPGYPPQPGYPPRPGYPPQPGYQPHPGYPPQPGYQPQPGYPPPPGYQPQPGYPPQPGYSPSATTISQLPSEIKNIIISTPAITKVPYEEEKIQVGNSLVTQYVFIFPDQRLSNAKMKLVLSYPYQPPVLSILPDKGYRVVPTNHYTDLQSRVIFKNIVDYCRSYRLSQYLDEFFGGLGHYQLVVPDRKDEYCAKVKEQVEKPFTDQYRQYYEQVQAQERDREDLMEKAQTLQDICHGIKDAMEKNRKAADKCAKENEKLQEQKAFLQEGHSIQADYRSAFTFRKDDRRLLVELGGFEKVSKEIHTHYQRALGTASSSESTQEILRAIRENSKLMFKSRFMKDILEKQAGSSGTQRIGGAGERSIPQIAGYAAFH